MPVTRSAASGNKKLVENDAEAKKPKASKRQAVKDTDDAPPKKTGKKAVEPKENTKKGKRKEADNKEKQQEEDDANESVDISENAETIYEFKANDIKGNEMSLDIYKGHVCIIVNVASKCGHTKSNYEQLVEIYDKYSEEKGLRILAFPCNQFGKQEPGDNAKICEFAEKKNVKFDMFEKIDVNGKNAHPLWKFLTSKIDGPKGKNVAWNFVKFIIDKDGKVVERHASGVKPLKLVENLEKYW